MNRKIFTDIYKLTCGYGLAIRYMFYCVYPLIDIPTSLTTSLVRKRAINPIPWFYKDVIVFSYPNTLLFYMNKGAPRIYMLHIIYRFGGYIGIK